MTDATISYLPVIAVLSPMLLSIVFGIFTNLSFSAIIPAAKALLEP